MSSTFYKSPPTDKKRMTMTSNYSSNSLKPSIKKSNNSPIRKNLSVEKEFVNEVDMINDIIEGRKGIDGKLPSKTLFLNNSNQKSSNPAIVYKNESTYINKYQHKDLSMFSEKAIV